MPRAAWLVRFDSLTALPARANLSKPFFDPVIPAPFDGRHGLARPRPPYEAPPRLIVVSPSPRARSPNVAHPRAPARCAGGGASNRGPPYGHAAVRAVLPLERGATRLSD